MSTELEQVTELLREALMTDGAHHKQWFLVQIATALHADIEDLDYEPGIAP